MLWGSQVEEGLQNPDFHLYLVENVRKGDRSAFALKDIPGGPLTRLLERARERRYCEVPLPVADYDKMVNLDLPG